MRYVYLALTALMLLVVLLFVFENLALVTVSFLSANATLPISLMVIVVYILGMFTGTFLTALIRGWLRRATKE